LGVKKLWLTLVLGVTALCGYSQNRATVKGKVADSASRAPMEFATVAVLNLQDTTNSLVAYMVTDKTGSFALHNLPAGVPLKVLITFVSYRPFRKFMTLAKAETVDIGTVSMAQNLLNEVTITGERPPIVIKKDTIEFNAEAFKTRPNAVVEDLLKKLPGIEVANDGTITAGDKKVSKILVDGREFFASDPRIASKNLDADMIDKVQLYDDRENDPDHLIPESKVEKIINLKFKKKLKKAIFGKVYAGGGTEDRYNTGGLFNMFRDTLQVSLIGQGNNLNDTGFSFNDLYQYGGLNRSGGSFSAIGGGGFGFGASNGIQKELSAGANINTDYGRKLKLNLAYYYARTHSEYNNLTTRQQFLNNTDIVNSTTTNRVRSSNKHNITANMRMQPDYATQITYNPRLSFSDDRSDSYDMGSTSIDFVSLLNQSSNAGNSTGNTLSFEHTFGYNRQLKKQGSSINITQNLTINPSDGINYTSNNLTSYVSTFPSYALNRQGNTNNRNTNANLGVSYRYPLSKKLTGDIGFASSYSHNVNNSATYDLDPVNGYYDSFLQILSGNLTRNLEAESIAPGITYNFKKGMSLVTSLNTQFFKVNNQFDRGLPDIDQNYVSILPSARLTIKSVSIDYSQSFQLPNIGDIIPYSVVFSPLYAVTGNPGLKPTKRDNFGFSYNNSNRERQTSLNLSVGAGIEQNTIFRTRTLDAVGAETSMPINRDGKYSLSSRVSFNKTFKKNKGLRTSLYSTLNVNRAHNFFELNHQDGYQDQYLISLNETLSLNWKDIVTLDTHYGFSGNMSTYSGINFKNVNYATHNVDSHFNIFWPKRIDIEGNYTYTYNSTVPSGYQKSSNLLSVSVARAFLKKDRGEIKLSCYDILNQAIGSNRSVYENNITDTQSQILSRYFMLSLQWRFNKSTVKNDDKRIKPMPVLVYPTGRLGN
jgi:hypothetical protein